MVSNLTVSGKKLLWSLLVMARMMLYSLPDGKGVKSLWDKWEVSSAILVAWWIQLLFYEVSMVA